MISPNSSENTEQRQTAEPIILLAELCQEHGGNFIAIHDQIVEHTRGQPRRIAGLALLGMALGSLQTPKERIDYWVQRGIARDREHVLGINGLDFQFFYTLALDDLAIASVRHYPDAWSRALEDLAPSVRARLSPSLEPESPAAIEKILDLRNALVQEWHPQGMRSKKDHLVMAQAKPDIEGLAYETFVADEDYYRELASSARIYPNNWSSQIAAEFVLREGHEYS